MNRPFGYAPEGDFYTPGLSRDGRSGWVPGAPDLYRRLFLKRAAECEPELLKSLRELGRSNDADALSAWGQRWNLTDRWCLVLAAETLRWWNVQPDAHGWEFQGKGIVAMYLPFEILPLQLGEHYWDPTWWRRADFQEDVLKKVRSALYDYCDRVEAAALKEGLKRAPRIQEDQHLDWLVRYQIKGESFADIARTNSKPKHPGRRQTVRKAIMQLAGYIELTVRM